MASAAVTNTPSRSIFDDLSYTRTALLVLKWLGWGALCFAAAAVVLLVCLVTYVGVAKHRRRKAELARRRRLRRRQQRLRRQQRARVMRSFREAPYEQKQMVAELCVVCMAEYEAGETCSILPRCAHVYHKKCIATWLTYNNTCPMCRAPLVVAPPTSSS